MKGKVMVLGVVVSSMLFSATAMCTEASCPVSSGEFDKLVQSNMKDQCLIVAKNCGTETSSVQQRVNELRVEIGKGLDVYSPSELRALKEQLKWIETESGNQFI
jgi:hypothetical protein